MKTEKQSSKYNKKSRERNCQAGETGSKRKTVYSSLMVVTMIETVDREDECRDQFFSFCFCF